MTMSLGRQADRRMSDRLRFYPPGRRCDLPYCITILNHCNPGPYCLLHTERIAALEFADDGYARLWVAIELTRRGMPEKAKRAATASIN